MRFIPPRKKAWAWVWALAFCKEAVEAAGGEIFCTSVYGQGTTFVVLLPTKDKEAQKLQDQREAEEHAEERARKEKIRQETLAYARRFIANGWSDERISRATHFDIDVYSESSEKSSFLKAV